MTGHRSLPPQKVEYLVLEEYSRQIARGARTGRADFRSAARFVYGTIAWKTASNQASRRVRTVSQLASICLATAASTAG